MNNKIKASELFSNLVATSQVAYESEEEKLHISVARDFAEMENATVEEMQIKMSVEFVEYIKFSTIKALILTLIDFGLIEKDIDLMNEEKAKELISIGLAMARKKAE